MHPFHKGIFHNFSTNPASIDQPSESLHVRVICRRTSNFVQIERRCQPTLLKIFLLLFYSDNCVIVVDLRVVCQQCRSAPGPSRRFTETTSALVIMFAGLWKNF